MLDAGTLTGVSLKCEDPHKTAVKRETGMETGASWSERREQLTVCHNVDLYGPKDHC